MSIEHQLGRQIGIDKKDPIGKGLPKHILIVPDGNRRGAREHGLTIAKGYKVGAQKVAEIAEYAKSLGVEFLTFGLITSADIKERESQELGVCYDAIQTVLLGKSIPDLVEAGVKIRTLGFMDRQKIPVNIVDGFEQVQKDSEFNTGMVLTFVINYGGDAKIEEGPEPDLVIRTGGKLDLNDFIQIKAQNSREDYIDTNWPDFTTQEFRKSIGRFAATKKTFGA